MQLESCVQNDASLILKKEILRAGAGAGKTTTLTQIFFRTCNDFKKSKGCFPKVVLTTFTRKATQELRERILALCLENKDQDLFHYINQSQNIHISTIHGILSAFLGKYGKAIGLQPDFQVISTQDELNDIRKFLRQRLLSSTDYIDLLDEFSFLELEKLLLKYFENSFFHNHLQEVTYRELLGLYESSLQDIGSNLKKQILSIHIDKENFKSEKNFLDWNEYFRAWKNFLNSEFSIDSLSKIKEMHEFLPGKPRWNSKTPPISPAQHDLWVEHVDRFEDLINSDALSAEYLEKYEKLMPLFSRLAKSFSEDYLNWKLERSRLSMSELESFSLLLCRRYPEMATRFAAEWDYWMIDEYQDTSPIQVELLRSLIADQPHFVVGDPQQSIYLFRGARVEVFTEKWTELQGQGGETRETRVNYRSESPLLHFINDCFAPFPGFMAMDPAKKVDKKKCADIYVCEKSKVDSFKEERQVLFHIQKLIENNSKPEDICVLSRNNQFLLSLSKLASHYHLPVQLHSAGGFFSKREVTDALCFLKFLANPHDNFNFICLLRSPWFNLSDTQIHRGLPEKRKSFWAEMSQKYASDVIIQKLNAYLILSENIGISETFLTFLTEDGMLESHQILDPSGQREANLWKLYHLIKREESQSGFNIIKFIESSKYEMNLEQGNMDIEATPVLEPARVNLMTVHASKGLQFKHVLIAGMGKETQLTRTLSLSVDEKDEKFSLSFKSDKEQKTSPHIFAQKVKSGLNQRELLESQRVLYVAMTRAKESLALFWTAPISKNSWASYIPLSLTPGLHEASDYAYEVCYEEQQPKLFNVAETALGKGIRSLYEPKESEAKSHLSVTRWIESMTAKEVKFSGRTVDPVDGLKIAQRGVQAHRLFEALEAHQENLTKLVHLSSSEEKAIDYILNRSEAPMRTLLGGSGMRGSSQAEWGFVLHHKNYLIQGQIDLWGQAGQTIWVVDYKTGSTAYADKAFYQLHIYAWALEKMKQVPSGCQIKLAVIYPFEEKTLVQDFDHKLMNSLQELEIFKTQAPVEL